MDSDWIIGALAFVTIGLVIAFAVYHFGFFLKDPRNKGAAKNVVTSAESASTKVAEDAPDGSYHDRTLKERLDNSLSSKHPYDPDPAMQGVE